MIEKLKKILFEILYFCHLYGLACKVSPSLYWRKIGKSLAKAFDESSKILIEFGKAARECFEQRDDINESKTL